MPYKSILLSFFLSVFVLIVDAQEIHFSQFSNSQLLINPAFAGNFNGNLRLGASYRNQGSAISVPYTTYSAWGDMRIETERLSKSAIGFGLSVYNDNAGEGSLNTTSGYFTASFIKGFNRDNTIHAALGFSVGMINRSINFSRLVFDNQWDGTIFDPNVANGEPYVASSLFAPDFNFGGILSWDINEKLNANFGMALHHINQPQLTFYESENRLENRLVLHVLMNSRIGDQFEINPGVYFSTQRGVNEILIGSDFLVVHDDFKLFTGLWYRHERDIIPDVGIVYDGFILEFSYDINVSKLHIASNYRGGMEISIVKTFSINQKEKSCNGF